jgi:hypothetical protein
MALYPVTVATLRERVGKYPLLARRTDIELKSALDTARAEIELAFPRAAGGGLTESEDRIAATIQSDLAMYYLRWEIERSEEGAPPAALTTYYEQIQKRLSRLARQSSFSGAKTIAAYDPLDVVDFPS